ncbi:Hydrogenosomal oxygen reductase [Trichomonas vaginalis G3]|uniref:Hydrogenosomal oxygen reductase n=2 Tax=Trichomonas vaginalis TaxID=5722 RepID=A0A8U0WPX3_TRIV3|nr:hydrogenosomal oxygen reductase, anaerobic nitric oxide reductase flavorubredoxin family [Trichomonas vaginalis G3]AAP57086.1 putative hydrogenosomal oxygen reductase [Trichomonas vaginalis]EAY22576.1 Hydrogenosomal oxygen reductase [Trichomonas vaginalis G3]KAI5497309.1 hydrogenosomal oxygen reductase, anaerobic nitric oxide reductase flavorubredoxin family [Trichomonas vaginalis G3]|eukprot:XP_001583562.1 Hydrogenosomal oxygen reductase [Trichomonas vaginalis G3]
MLSTSSARSFSALDLGVTKVADDVLWIGVNDWDLREFHSMQSPVGTSYNSYLIQSSEPTIVDAVKYTMAHAWIDRLKSIGGDDLKGIKRIIVQHAEPDHSSGTAMLVKEAPHIEVVMTKQCYNTMARFYDVSKWNVKIVKLGEKINLGDRVAVMAGVPMAHWPESAVTYLPAQKILFSSDCFGQHIASNKRFVDEVDQGLFLTEIKSYYANILQRLGKPVLKALATASKLPGLDIVLPAHGVGFRRKEDLEQAIKLYTQWATYKPNPKVSVIYDCNWYGTEKMAEAVASGICKEKLECIMMNARKTHITRSATEVMDSAAVAFGSSTLHECILPDIAMHLNYLRCLGIHDKPVGLFGTFGWQEKIVPNELRNAIVKPCKIPEVAEPVMAHWNPKEADLAKCEELGRKLALAAIEKCK